jgi:hypothetical protein
LTWISIKNQLPENDQRILAYIPDNKVYFPGKTLEFELRDVIVLRFLKDFYLPNTEKCAKYGPHFWQGEGNSNHFFSDVTHWMPMPEGPNLAINLS